MPAIPQLVHYGAILITKSGGHSRVCLAESGHVVLLSASVHNGEVASLSGKLNDVCVPSLESRHLADAL